MADEEVKMIILDEIQEAAGFVEDETQPATRVCSRGGLEIRLFAAVVVVVVRVVVVAAASVLGQSSEWS